MDQLRCTLAGPPRDYQAALRPGSGRRLGLANAAVSAAVRRQPEHAPERVSLEASWRIAAAAVLLPASCRRADPVGRSRDRIR